MIKEHPDIDCVFLNAGIQSIIDLSKPSMDLAAFNNEIKVNFTSFVALTHAFLPFLRGKEGKTSLVL